MNKIFQVPASIDGVSTMKDRTLKLNVYISKELPGDQMAALFNLNKKEGWFLFSENTFQTSDIPQETAKTDRNVKTPSQRLYAVLFVLFKQTNNSGSFEEWRNSYMERLIENIKSELN